MNEELIKDLKFQKYDGNYIKDVHKYVKHWVIDNEYGSVTIGCDSQEHARYVKYAVTIVMHMRDESGIGHGGHIIFTSFKDSSKNMKSDVFTKLWAETEITVAVAKLVGDIGLPIKIHLDYNSDKTKYSNILYNAGIGFGSAAGFETYGKPHSWCASHTADRIAKSGKR